MTSPCIKTRLILTLFVTASALASDVRESRLRLPGDHTISAAIINHPSNPETRWHCAAGPRVINPCITSTRDDVILKAGVPLTLRYRVIAQDGASDAKRMSEWAASQPR